MLSVLFLDTCQIALVYSVIRFMSIYGIFQCCPSSWLPGFRLDQVQMFLSWNLNGFQLFNLTMLLCKIIVPVSFGFHVWVFLQYILQALYGMHAKCLAVNPSCLYDNFVCYLVFHINSYVITSIKPIVLLTYSVQSLDSVSCSDKKSNWVQIIWGKGVLCPSLEDSHCIVIILNYVTSPMLMKLFYFLTANHHDTIFM